MEAVTATARVRPVRHRRVLALGRALLDQSLNLYAALALIYLLAPIAIIILFSFNDTQSRFNFTWQGFTLEHWKDPFGVPGLREALVNSLEIAALSTVIATVLGTMMALALVRYQFRGRATTNLFIFLPLAAPEIVLGASLLSLFIASPQTDIGLAPFQLGFTTILIAHVMFNISFVVVTVRSRLIGFDRSLEEAAQDLGANGFQTFMRITLPLIAPGVLAAALLAFALSVDDFVITSFNSGSTVTFPLFVWGAARVAIPPQINIIATMIFFATLALMVLTVLQQRRAARMSAVRPEPV
jgi:spermidine/putrescine transport system permease protein